MAKPHTDSTVAPLKVAGQQVPILIGAAPNGSYLRTITFQAATGGNNALSVGRAYLHPRDAQGRPERAPIGIGEITLTATTASATGAVAAYTLQVDRVIPPYWAVLVELGTTVVTGYHVVADGEELDGQSVYAAGYVPGV